MFDIGFSELLVIGIVALVVLGPERLPRVARTLGHLFGRMQRYVAEVKSEINSEMELEEFKKIHGDLRNTIHNAEQEFKTAGQEFKRETQDIESGLTFADEPKTATPQLELGLEQKTSAKESS